MNNCDAMKNIAELDAGIHNPARLMIVYLLVRNPALDYLELMRLTRLSSGNITTHLGKLVDSGYITITKSFRGKKPHTSVQLTECGRIAYLKWGEAISCALPEQLRHSLGKIEADISIAVKPVYLFIREKYTVAHEGVGFMRTPQYYLQGMGMPPREDSFVI